MKDGTQLRKTISGFTLIELLVSMAVLSIFLLLISSLIQTTSDTWVRAKDRTAQFREARQSFEYITRNLQQATLNAYWDYYYESSGSNVPKDGIDELPARHVPHSDLQFLAGNASKLILGAERDEGARTYRGHAVFFQVPLGKADRYADLSNLLNARGFFIEFGDEREYLPEVIRDRTNPRNRYRLMEFRPPAEENVIYKDALEEAVIDPDSPVKLDKWFQPDSALYSGRHAYHELVRPVAENVIAMIISPQWSAAEAENRGIRPESIAPDYEYNSNRTPPARWNDPTRHQLPPLIEVVLVTISEKSAFILQGRHGDSPPPELELDPEWFVRASDLEADLEALEKKLVDEGIEFRLFRSTLRLQASKWTNVEYE